MVSIKVIPRGLTAVSDIDLRLLAETSDARDVFLSVYLPTATGADVDLNEGFVSSRVGVIRNALDGELEEDFEKTLSMVEELLFHKPIHGERGRVVFASEPRSFLHVYRLGVEPERRLVLDNSPFILPLEELDDTFEDYGIILMDSREARLYLVRSRVIEEVGASGIDLMNKHKKGGMSQKRFNRLRRGAIRHFISQITEDLRDLKVLHDIEGLVVAGPGEGKKHLMDALPPELGDRVIGVLDVPIDASEDELLARGEEVASAQEDREDRDALNELMRAAYKDELAALGVPGVLGALVQGRVDTLLFLEGLSIPGWMCEGCKRIFEGPGPPGSCPDCGGPVSSAEVVEELCELAERTSATVEIVSSSRLLSSFDGVGAILRY